MILLGIPVLFLSKIFWVGLILMSLGILLFISVKNEYTVRISTNAGEADSTISKDKEYIQKIVNALNDAMIHRG